METPDPFSPQRISDRMAIQDVIHRWCRAVDRLDLEEIRPLFHHDAVDMHGPYEGGVEGLISWLRDRHSGISFSMHSVSNLIIEFASTDLALCECYVHHIQRYAADAGERLTSVTAGVGVSGRFGADLAGVSRYIDRFERRQGVWRIAHRTVVGGWRSLQEVPEHPCGSHPRQEVQRRDQMDCVFRAQRELGLR